MAKRLWKWDVDAGRGGKLSGLFVADEKQVAALRGKRLYLGEVLGKHSDVTVSFDDDGDMPVAVDAAIGPVESLSLALGDTWCGYDPVALMAEQGEDNEDDE